MRLNKTFKTPKRQAKLKAPLNNKCGIILFFHIPKTGGGSVQAWLETHTTVLDTYAMIHKYSRKNTQNETAWKKILPAANRFVRNMSSTKGWKAIHLHHYFPGMYYNKDIVQNWKTIVEGKGCVFHKTTMLRDPLSRFVSAYNYNHLPLDKVGDIMIRINNGRNQLARYLLFARCRRTDSDIKCGSLMPHLNENYTREMWKVINQFDSIGLQERFEDHLENIRKVTGWRDDGTKQTNNKKIHKSQDYLHLTSDMRKNFLNMNQEDYLLYYNIKNELAPIHQLDQIA